MDIKSFLPGSSKKRGRGRIPGDTGKPVLHPDVVVKENDPGTQEEYIVGLSYKKFFSVGQMEYEIIKLLDGNHTAAEIQTEFLKTRDLEIPINTIQTFINELASLELVSFERDLKARKCVNLNLPGIFYKLFSLVYKPVPLTLVVTLNLVSFIFFIVNIEVIFNFMSAYFSFYFVWIFILVFLVTNFFHEIGHGAAIGYFNFKPGPIQIKRGSGLFLLHFSTPFVIYTPEKTINRRMKLTIVSGGILFDFLLVSIGMLLFSLSGIEVLKISGVLLLFTALSRILISFNFFNENTDMAKILAYYFESAGEAYKKHMAYKLTGTLFWLLQYSVLFFLIYVMLYSVRANVTLPPG